MLEQLREQELIAWYSLHRHYEISTEIQALAALLEFAGWGREERKEGEGG